MIGHSDEISLLWCVLLNALVIAAAYRFAICRMTEDLGQAILDTALLFYAVQYCAVGLPGLVGTLSPLTMSGVAVLLSTALFIASFSRQIPFPKSNISSPIVNATIFFALGFIGCFAYFQRFLPVMSNDALTYHFPAAVQWLQRGKIEPFQVWFFNPANTYSPLAGSTFIAWLIAPFGNDVLARFVEIPALFFVGIGVFQLCRVLQSSSSTAAMIATAAMLSRPMLSQSMMAKDDLFVGAFFLCSLVSLAPVRAGERLSTLRLGLSLGLLLATKYTALFSLPILLLAIDGPKIADWRWRKWLTTLSITAIVSGPWYLRNVMLTRNPFFPIDLRVAGWRMFSGLFSPVASQSLRSVREIYEIIVGGGYGLTAAIGTVLAICWLTIAWKNRNWFRHNSIGRACLIGPIAGILLFIWRSPFPEVRFVFPSFLLLFALVAVAIDSAFESGSARLFASILMIALAVGTTFVSGRWQQTMTFSSCGLVMAAGSLAVCRLTRRINFVRKLSILAGTSIVGLSLIAYVNWTAYVQDYRELTIGRFSPWSFRYGSEEKLWGFVNNSIPNDAILAYTNTYLVYPLHGFSLKRRILYVPTQANIQTMANLPRLGDELSGEQIVPLATAATMANPDQAVWLANLSRSGAQFLLVGKGGLVAVPPEYRFTNGDPARFKPIFENESGVVYALLEPVIRPLN